MNLATLFIYYAELLLLCRIEVDYSQVPVDDLETVADMREEEERLQRKVDLLDAEIKQKQVPNMNVIAIFYLNLLLLGNNRVILSR